MFRAPVVTQAVVNMDFMELVAVGEGSAGDVDESPRVRSPAVPSIPALLKVPTLTLRLLIPRARVKDDTVTRIRHDPIDLERER